MIIKTGIDALDSRLNEYFPSTTMEKCRVGILNYSHLHLASNLGSWTIIAVLYENQEVIASTYLNRSAPVSLISLTNEMTIDEVLKQIVRETLCLMRHQESESPFFFDALRPYYQGIYNATQSNPIYSVEALARVQFGEGRTIMPSDIFRWMSAIDNAQIFSGLCGSTPAHYPRVSFNIDCNSILEDAAYSIICSAIILSSLKITLEVNEAAFHINKKDAPKLMSRFESLSKLGASLSLDDFGKSSSNYDRLHQFGCHFTQLKIDKELFRKLTDGLSVIGAGLKLSGFIDGLPEHVTTVVIEGVEKQKHLAIIMHLQQEVKIPVLIQGFFLSQPSPTIEFQEVLAGAL